MATFIKLINGEVINSLAISSVRKHEHATVEEHIRARVRARQDNGSAEQYLDAVPSIQVFRSGEPNPTLLKFDSVELRDEEFDRIESLLLPTPKSELVQIDGKIINPKHLAALYIEYYRGDYRLVIKVAGIPTITRYCRREEGAIMMAAYKEILGVEVFDRVTQNTNQIDDE